jgi:3-deoxy-D-manno-octulosonic-acid transferase
MKTYRAFASAAALWNFLRGESPRQPTYVAGGQRRVRRSLRDLGQAFSHGWDRVARGEHSGALMVYAATIGEFHPLKPVIDHYLRIRPGMPLVFISGQLQYMEAMHAAYPQAAVCVPPPGAPWLYDRLFALTRPRVLALGEGPCRHLYFPIAFDLALPAACLRYKVPMVVVNATMHRHLVASKLDAIEGKLYGDMFDRALRFCYTPNDIFKSWLMRGGIPEERIVVTGDLRFDGLSALGHTQPEFAEVLAHFSSRSDPVIVAGSVNAIDEEGPIIDAWLALRRRYPGARLIMAPRHINAAKNMTQLYDYLQAKGVRYARRSEGIAAIEAADALIVDGFGELPHYYSVASIAYIGRNHGVLEPLRFEVPTVVAPRADWQAEYVTYPAYKLMIDEGGIVEAPDKAQLGDIFLRIAAEPGYGRGFVDNALRVAASQRGAGKRIVEHIESNAQ